ncbi:MAG: palindromic element RPE5 domain-containing protein [Rickettsia endosymbiont of Argas persicus]
MEKSKETVSREERSVYLIREHPRSYKVDVANFLNKTSISISLKSRTL